MILNCKFYFVNCRRTGNKDEIDFTSIETKNISNHIQ